MDGLDSFDRVPVPTDRSDGDVSDVRIRGTELTPTDVRGRRRHRVSDA